MNHVTNTVAYVRDMDERYQIALLVAGVGLLFIVFLWRLTWERRAYVAQTVEAFAVVLTLALAWFQYREHYAGDINRKRQAVVDILRSTMGSPVFGPAYHHLYDYPPADVLAMKREEFDKKIAPLSDIFWTVGTCAFAEQCDVEVARKAFCFDFKSYEFAYNHAHSKEERWQSFNDERLDLFCDCPDKHRFSEPVPGRSAEPWPRCQRSKEVGPRIIFPPSR